MIYDYHCQHCGADIENNFPMGEQPSEVVCICGEMAEREIKFNGIFKGLTTPGSAVSK